MRALAQLTITSFLLCSILTPLLRDLFSRLRIVDHPDCERKHHSRPIPRIGGIPIALSYAGALALMLLFAPRWAQLSIQHSKLMLELLPAASVIFLIGLLDDLITLKPWQKLAGQALAAALAVSFGATISLSPRHSGPLWLTVPLSMFWLVGCSNAFNLLDGMDGLATGVGLLAAVTTATVALMQGNLGLAMATAPLAGCLFAFLRYNFNPASVFLGDSGSLTIGFMLGCFSLIWGQHSNSLWGMAAPAMAMTLPLVDTALAIYRRLLRNKPIFQGDHGHIHHMMLALGFNARDASLILLASCSLGAVLAVLQSITGHHLRELVLLLFMILVGVGVNCLGYVEVTAARRTGRMLFRHLKEELFLPELTRSLAEAESVDDCWTVIYNTCRDLNFASVQMSLNQKTYSATFLARRNEAAPWNLTVGLGRVGLLTLTRSKQDGAPQYLIAVLDRIQQAIGKREHVVEMIPSEAVRELQSVMSLSSRSEMVGALDPQENQSLAG